MRAWVLLAFTVFAVPVSAEMPAIEQNALVKKYCAVCHTDAARNGGLSLEHYDAAQRDPGLAAMMLSKLNSGAMGAAGIGVPDKPTQQAWVQSTREQAVGAERWFVRRSGGTVSAGIVRTVSPRKPGAAEMPLYRLILTCDPALRESEMMVAWSPEPQTGRTMRVSVDGASPVEYRIEGKESMGNGATVQTGQASAVLRSHDDRRLAFAKRSLVVHDLFPGETVEFPFAELDGRTSAELRECFAR
jgi:hypothetical protein